MNPNFRSETTGDEVVSAFPQVVAGRIFMVTGPSSKGIGAATLVSLARAHPKALILAGRTPSSFKATEEAIRSIDSSIDVIPIQLDLSSLVSVRAAVVELQQKVTHIDVLINNAGIMATTYGKTVDGIEQQFATNHVGHFLLTSLLLPKLLAAESPRVINLTSSGHRFALGHYADYNFEVPGSYDPWTAYGQSKLANILFTRGLAKRYGSRGMMAYAVHPGSVATDLLRYIQEGRMDELGAATERSQKDPDWENRRRKTPEEGCSTTLVAALTPSLEPNGAYLSDCQLGHPKAIVFDAEVEEKLWELSENLIGHSFGSAH